MGRSSGGGWVVVVWDYLGAWTEGWEWRAPIRRSRRSSATQDRRSTEALKKAKPGDTLQVTGTCHERVTITTDRLTLDGDGSAVLDGGGGGPTEFEGVVTIDGVQGVTLMGFTVQNGPGVGILGDRWSSLCGEEHHRAG